MATEPRQAPGIGLTTALPEGATWKTEMDANLVKASITIQLAVLDRVAAIPGSPTHGDMYILTAAPHDKTIAAFDDDHWVYLTPTEGWKAYVLDEAVDYIFDGADWVVYNPGAGALDPDLSDIAALTPTNDDIMQRKAGHWTNRTMAQLATDLALAATYQPLDSDLTAIAALTPTNDDVMQRKGGAWVNRTIAQLTVDLTGLQPIDSDLTAIAAISPTNDDIMQRKGGVWVNRSMTQLAVDLVSPLSSSLQPLDSDLTAIAAISPSNDDIIQRKAGAWTNRTMAQLQSDLGITGGGGSYVAKGGDTMTGGLTTIPGDLTTGAITFGSSNPGQVAQAQDTVGAGIAGIASSVMMVGNIARQTFGVGTPNLQMNATSTGAGVATARWNNSASVGARVSIGHSRGATVGSMTTLNNADTQGYLDFLGSDGTGLTIGAEIAAIVSGTISAGVMPSRLSVRTATSAGTVTEVLGIEADGSMTMGGSANAWFDTNRVWHPREYTVGTAPSVTGTGVAQFSDEGGGRTHAYYDSVVSAFRRMDDSQVISATAGARGLISRYPTRQSKWYRDLVTDTYRRLSDAGLLAKLKGLWVFAAPTQAIALMNWITPGTRDVTITGSPTFTANHGFQGDGSTAQLNTAASIATFGVLQNDNSMGVYVRTAGSSSAAILGQTNAGVFARRYLIESDASGTLDMNDSSGTLNAFTVTGGRYTGLFGMSRNNSANFDAFQDENITNLVRASASPGAAVIGFLATQDGTANTFSNGEVAFGFVGTALTATEIRMLRSILVDRYLVAVGAVTATKNNPPPVADFTGEWYYFPDLITTGVGGMSLSDGTNWRSGRLIENSIQYSDMTTAITTGVNKGAKRFMRNFYVTKATSVLVGGVATGTHTIDANIGSGGTSIFTTNPSIATGNEDSIQGGSTAAVLTSTPFLISAGQTLSIDVDAAGGKGGQLILEGYYV